MLSPFDSIDINTGFYALGLACHPKMFFSELKKELSNGIISKLDIHDWMIVDRYIQGSKLKTNMLANTGLNHDFKSEEQ